MNRAAGRRSPRRAPAASRAGRRPGAGAGAAPGIPGLRALGARRRGGGGPGGRRHDAQTHGDGPALTDGTHGRAGRSCVPDLPTGAEAASVGLAGRPAGRQLRPYGAESSHAPALSPAEATVAAASRRIRTEGRCASMWSSASLAQARLYLAASFRPSATPPDLFRGGLGAGRRQRLPHRVHRRDAGVHPARAERGEEVGRAPSTRWRRSVKRAATWRQLDGGRGTDSP